MRRFHTISTHCAAPLSTQATTRQIDVSDPNFRSLFTPELELLASIFQRYNHELRIAGGAVRDILMNRRPGDVDFATTATPAEMLDIFNAEEVRVVHDRGAAHGTLMVRVNDKEVNCGKGRMEEKGAGKEENRQ